MQLEPVDNERLANLCGQFDEHLRLLERRTGVEIGNRGNQFKLTGSDDDVVVTERVIRSLYSLTGSKTISPADVHLELRNVDGDDGDAADELESTIRTRRGVIKNHYKGAGGYFKAAVDIYMHELIAKTELEQKAQMRCFAGDAGGVIYDEGTVSSCEKLDSIGNLRDYDWDFSKLWYSSAMDARRKQVKDGCFCTHESNSYYPSLAFNPKHLIQIKRLERQMKNSAAHLPHPVHPEMVTD